jgi:hypothetical protein
MIQSGHHTQSESVRLLMPLCLFESCADFVAASPHQTTATGYSFNDKIKLFRNIDPRWHL